jgi:hypothetical protein
MGVSIQESAGIFFLVSHSGHSFIGFISEITHTGSRVVGATLSSVVDICHKTSFLLASSILPIL